MVEECLACARKHILESEVFLSEANASANEERRRDKLLDAFKNIQAAETHVSDKHPEIARKIREVKKRLEPSLDSGETSVSLSDLRSIVKQLGGECEDCNRLETGLEELEQESSLDGLWLGLGLLVSTVLIIGLARFRSNPR